MCRYSAGGVWTLIEDDLLAEEHREPDHKARPAGAVRGPAFLGNANVLWYCVWGAMAFFTAVNALAPYSVLSGKYCALFGILLGAFAAIQSSLGVSFLSRKEFSLAIVALLLFISAQVGQRLHTIPARIDFSAYYVAGRVASEHPPGRLYYHSLTPDGRIAFLVPSNGWRQVALNYGVATSIPFVYPPFFAVLMKPLAYLSYDLAYGLWNGIAVVLTLASVLISLTLGGVRITPKLALVMMVGLFSYYPFFQELLLGQVASLILFLCAFGIWLLAQNREWPSAFCFAAATMIKITPVFLVPLFLFHRKWKWLAAYGCWMMCLTAFSIWQGGWAAHAQFLHSVMPSVSCGIVDDGNVSIVAYVQDLFVGFVPKTRYLSALPPLACSVSKAVGWAIYGAVILRLYFNRRKQDFVRHLALVMLLSLVISPIAWLHHYTTAIFPFIYLWCVKREPGRDLLLLATALVTGTNIVGFALILSNNHLMQLILASVVPCLTLVLIYFRVPSEDPHVPRARILSLDPIKATVIHNAR